MSAPYKLLFPSCCLCYLSYDSGRRCLHIPVVLVQMPSGWSCPGALSVL